MPVDEPNTEKFRSRKIKQLHCTVFNKSIKFNLIYTVSCLKENCNIDLLTSDDLNFRIDKPTGNMIVNEHDLYVQSILLYHSYVAVEK